MILLSRLYVDTLGKVLHHDREGLPDLRALPDLREEGYFPGLLARHH